MWHLEEFESPDTDALRKALAALEKRLPEWADRARECARGLDTTAEACSLGGLDPVRIALPKRRADAAGDPLYEKWQDTLDHNRAASPSFSEGFLTGTTIRQYDRGPRGGRYKLFIDNGQPRGGIFWHPEHGAKIVYGTILTEYLRRGGCGDEGAESPLGYPIKDEELLPAGLAGTRHGRDRVSRFERGMLWRNADTQCYPRAR